MIVGSQQVTGPDGQARTFAAAWWSAGLAGWHRAADATTGALDGLDGSRQMLAVAATADGFVAVGAHGPLPAAWITADGRTWRLADLPLPPGATAAALQHVAAAGRTVVATGVAQAASGPVPVHGPVGRRRPDLDRGAPARARGYRAGQRGGRGRPVASP